MSEPEIPTLPALRSLGNLAGVRPVVVVDTREQCPLPFGRLAVERGTLASGDYSFRGGEELFAVERKSIPDLAACCVGDNRDRFFRELHRLRGFRFKRLLIVGSREEIEQGEYVSQIKPQAVLATLRAFEVRFDMPVAFAPSPARRH
jgi:ERCC4-type nuclease